MFVELNGEKRYLSNDWESGECIPAFYRLFKYFPSNWMIVAIILFFSSLTKFPNELIAVAGPQLTREQYVREQCVYVYV